MSTQAAVTQLVADARSARRLPSRAMARQIRIDAGLTQDQIAEVLGVHRVTINRWEAGTTTPTGRQRVQYARLLEELQGLAAS